MYCNMIPVAHKDTRDINKFIYVPIPSPRDMFLRYGARTGSEGAFFSDGSSQNPIPSGSTVIQSVINGQRLLEKEISSISNENV